MRIVSTLTLTALACAGGMSLSKNAWALGPVDVEVAAKVGVASRLTTGGGPDPLGFGIGGRAGVSIFSTFYAGLSALYYVGNSQSFQGGTLSDHAVQYGVEAGYNIYLLKWIGAPEAIASLLTLRPQVGVGNLTITVDEKNTNPSSGITNPFSSVGAGGNDQSNLYIEPGLTGLVSLGPFLAGLDLNALWVPSLQNSNVAVTAHAQLGLKF